MIRKPVRVTPTNLFQPDGRSSAEGSLSDTTDVSRRGIARIAAGKADVPPDLAEPLRHATMLIANLRVVLPECEGDRNVMSADRDPAAARPAGTRAKQYFRSTRQSWSKRDKSRPQVEVRGLKCAGEAMEQSNLTKSPNPIDKH